MTRRPTPAPSLPPVAPVAAIALAVVCGLFLLASPAAGKREPRARTWAYDFRADTLGQAPTGSIVMAGVWTVVEDSTARAPGAPRDSSGMETRVLRQAEGEEAASANWIRLKKPTVENGEISVRFRIRSGELDPSVGIAFHLDPKGRNGYLVRVSGEREELIAHYLILGKRRDIKMVPVAAPAAGEWHTLGIRRRGIRTFVTYDGEAKMEIRDERYRRGTVGLWTEDDTEADFVDWKITAR
jgi:hypothetical protein